MLFRIFNYAATLTKKGLQISLTEEAKD